MVDLREDDSGTAFDRAFEPVFASITEATADGRSPRLVHHFQKNQPEHASVRTARMATIERRKRFGWRASSTGCNGTTGDPPKGFCCWACLARFKASLIRLIR